jgi:hypothetical protein
MTIETVRDGLKTLQEAIPGVRKAYAQLPRGMVFAMDMPLFLNFVRESEYDPDTLGDDQVVVTRTYLMWLLVKPAAEGEEGEGESLVEPWIDVVSTHFYARPKLGMIATVQNSWIESDSGPRKLIWPGTQATPQGVYWGVEFRLKVVEYVDRTFADYE